VTKREGRGGKRRGVTYMEKRNKGRERREGRKLEEAIEQGQRRPGGRDGGR